MCRDKAWSIRFMHFVDLLSQQCSQIGKHWRVNKSISHKHVVYFFKYFVTNIYWRAKHWAISWLIHVQREIMTFRIAVACATWCHSVICHRGKRRGRLSYTMAIQVTLWSLPQSLLKCRQSLYGDLMWCSWLWLVKCCLRLYLAVTCYGVQTPAPFSKIKLF